jgi:uncharacterized paraquat-inducible protein A
MKSQKSRSKTGVVLILVSFVFLIPGLTAPIVTLSGSVDILFVKKQLFKDTRSVLQTITSLIESKNYFVAILIFMFGILVPLVKGILLLMVSGMKNESLRFKIYLFINNISKWAMADVFVTGIFVAFLAAKATQNMNAVIEPGFYFFVGYCLFSLLALLFIRLKVSPQSQ